MGNSFKNIIAISCSAILIWVLIFTPSLLDININERLQLSAIILLVIFAAINITNMALGDVDLKSRTIRFFNDRDLTNLKESFSFVFDNISFFGKTLILSSLLIIIRLISEYVSNIDVLGVLKSGFLIFLLVLLLIVSLTISMSWYQFYFYGKQKIFNPLKFLNYDFLYLKKTIILGIASFFLLLPSLLNPLYLYPAYKSYKAPSVDIEYIKLKHDPDYVRYLNQKTRGMNYFQRSDIDKAEKEKIRKKHQNRKYFLLAGIITSVIIYCIFYCLFIGIMLIIPAAAKKKNLNLKTAYLESHGHRLDIFSSFFILSMISLSVTLLLSIAPGDGFINNIIRLTGIFISNSALAAIGLITVAKFYDEIFTGQKIVKNQS